MRSTLTSFLFVVILFTVSSFANAQFRLVKGIYGKGTYNGYSAAEYAKNRNVFALSYEAIHVNRNDFQTLAASNNAEIFNLNYRGIGFSYRREGKIGEYGFQPLFGAGIQREDIVIWSGFANTAFNVASNRDFTKALKIDAFLTLRKHLPSHFFVDLTYQPGYRFKEKDIVHGDIENPFKPGLVNNFQINVGFSILADHKSKELDTFKAFHAVGAHLSNLHYRILGVTYERRFKPQWSVCLDISRGLLGGARRLTNVQLLGQSLFNNVYQNTNYGVGGKYFFSKNMYSSFYVIGRAHYQTAMFERSFIQENGPSPFLDKETHHITNWGGSMGIGVMFLFQDKWFFDASARSGMQWSNYQANVQIDYLPIKAGSLNRHQFTVGRIL